MQKKRRNQRHFRSIVFLAIACASLISSRTRAADNNQIQIEAGQTVEIGTDTNINSPEFSWILTKDRKFQNAQRHRFFESRFTQVGAYVLDVSIQNPDTGQNDYRAFSLVVTEPKNPATTLPPGNPEPRAALITDPTVLSGFIYLPPEGGIVKIDSSGSTGEITGYEIDLNSDIDSDGDGNPTNDRDNVNTFSEKDGTPLLFFFLPSQNQNRKIILTVLNANTGQTDSVSAELVFGGAASGSGPAVIQNPDNPITIRPDGLSVKFGSLISASGTGNNLLFEWDFGNRSRSLLDEPIHTYGAPGNYTVALKVRDIRTGQIIFAGTTNVAVTQAVQTDSSATSLPKSATSSASPAPSSGSSGFGFGSLIKVGVILFMLLAIVIAIYALFVWIKKKTTGTLEKTFERMEQTILKQDPKAAVRSGQAEPMKLKKGPETNIESGHAQEIADREKSHTDFNAKARDNITPLKASGPVPAWLTQSAARPAPQVTKAAVPSQGEPQLQPKPQPPASIPPWLRSEPAETPAKPEPQIPSPSPGPAADWLKPANNNPAPKPEPAQPQPKPPLQPQPPAAITRKEPPASVPPWLKPPDEKKAASAKPDISTEAKPGPVRPGPLPQTKPLPAQKPAGREPAPAKPPATPPPLKPQTPPEKSQPKQSNDDEPPIAIIQADSLIK